MPGVGVECDVVVVVAGTVVVTVGVVVVVTGAELDVLVVLVVAELPEPPHAREASWPTVAAPWPRFWSRVVLTVDGRFATALFSDVAALWAAAQLWASIAEETASSWASRLLL